MPETKSRTIIFSTNRYGINLTSNIEARLSCPSSINSGEPIEGTLAVTPGESSISFRFNYLNYNYYYAVDAVDSFTTPLGDKNVGFEDFVSGEIKAKFKTRVSATINSGSGDLVTPNSLTYTSDGSKSFSISEPHKSDQIELTCSFTYDATVEIIIVAPFTGETTVLGPYEINSIASSNNLSAIITVNSATAPPEEGILSAIWRLLSNPTSIAAIIVTILAAAVAVFAKRAMIA